MTCPCPECCEFRAARDDHKACALVVDYAVAARDKAYTDLRQAQRRYNAAHAAQLVAHAVPTPGHPATNRTEQQ